MAGAPVAAHEPSGDDPAAAPDGDGGARRGAAAAEPAASLRLGRSAADSARALVGDCRPESPALAGAGMRGIAEPVLLADDAARSRPPSGAARLRRRANDPAPPRTPARRNRR